jgi:LytS/YehU family sensor histidine kinase
MINFYIAYAWLTPRYFEKRRYGAFAAGVLLLLLLLTPLRMWVENHFIHRPFLLVRGRRLRGLVIFSEISVASFAFLFRMAIDSHLHIRKAAEVERLQLQTELKFLKSQMNPHFLFNTINNVYALSLEGSGRTPEALLRLSGLLRYLLYECNQKVPLSKELNALESYIALFQLRYEEPLTILLDSSAGDGERLVEPMLLIPLLENAIKHSGIGVEEGAFIEIDIREDGGALIAVIRNSRSGDPYIAQEVGGIGLMNIRKRLEMLGPGHSARDLSIRETDGLFSVTLKIPGI